MRTYLDEFLSLRCASDVLEAVHPLKRPEKEISESMALITAVRSLMIRNVKRNLVDLCAGNALTGIIAAHLFHADVLAVDKRPHARNGFVNVKNFHYAQGDVHALSVDMPENPNTVLIASHACYELSEAIIDLSLKRGVAMAIIPCCLRRSKLPNWTDGIAREKGKYFAWLTYLAQKAEGRFKIDKKCLSPCNGVVTRGL